MTFRRWLVVAPVGSGVLSETIAKLRNERWVRLHGHVREDGTGAAVSGVRIRLDDPSGRPVALTQSGPKGYAVSLPPGHYQLNAAAGGRRPQTGY